jgi:ribonuclease BN (tRNA processing enzyme)
VHCDGAWLLLDCPHPIRKVLYDSGTGLDVGDLLATVVTHLHADHASGLEGLGFFSHFALGRRARLLAHPDVLRDLWPHHLQAGMGRLIDATHHHGHDHAFDDYFDATELDEDHAVQIGPFRIECRRTIHHIPTFALRIHGGGRCLGWSADTAFDPTLIAWLGQADRIVHETNLGAHTPYEELAALPAELRDRMWLVHYPDDFDVGASTIACLEQGRRYDV